MVQEAGKLRGLLPGESRRQTFVTPFSAPFAGAGAQFLGTSEGSWRGRGEAVGVLSFLIKNNRPILDGEAVKEQAAVFLHLKGWLGPHVFLRNAVDEVEAAVEDVRLWVHLFELAVKDVVRRIEDGNSLPVHALDFNPLLVADDSLPVLVSDLDLHLFDPLTFGMGLGAVERE